MAIDLAALYANEAALKAKGFTIPGGAPVELEPQVIGASKYDYGMTDVPDATSGAVIPGAAANFTPSGGMSGMTGAPDPVVAATMNNAFPTAPLANPAGVGNAAPPPLAVAPPPAPSPPQEPSPAPTAVQASPTIETGISVETPKHPAAASFAAAAAPHPITLADKERAVLLPGQKDAFSNELEFRKTQQVWDATVQDKKLDIEGEMAAREAAALEVYSDKLAKEQADREEFEKYQSGEHAKLAQESDRIASITLDQNRLFKGDKGWLSIMAAAAGAVFGVLGAPATGGKNAGVEAINKAIDRDLDMQVRDLENRKQGAARKSTLLQQKMSLFGNKQQAMAAARIDAWKLALAKADSYAKQSGKEVHILEAAKLRDEGDRIIAREQENFGLGVEAGWKQIQAARDLAAARAAAGHASKLDKQNEKDDDAKRDVWKDQAKSAGGDMARVSPEMAARYAAENPGKAPLAVGSLTWIRPDGTPAPFSGKDAAGSTVTTMAPSADGGFSYGSATAKSPEHAKKWEETNSSLVEAISDLDRALAERDALNGGKVFDSGRGEAMGTSLALKVKEAAKNMSSDKDMNMIQTMVPKDVLETHPIKGLLPGDDPTTAKLKLMKEKLLKKKQINDAANLKPGQPETASSPSTLAAPVK